MSEALTRWSWLRRGLAILACTIAFFLAGVLGQEYGNRTLEGIGGAGLALSVLAGIVFVATRAFQVATGLRRDDDRTDVRR